MAVVSTTLFAQTDPPDETEETLSGQPVSDSESNPETETNTPLLLPPSPMRVTPATPSDLFPKPLRLRSAVRFWTEIFTRYEGHQFVLHDREDLSLIWQVIEVPLDSNKRVNPKTARNILQDSTVALKLRLQRLAKTGEPMSPEDDELLSALRVSDSKNINDAWQRVRAQKGIAENFRAGLERAEQWLAVIERILVEENVPLELAALPFVESSFTPNARSSAGAAGLWQLMPATARQLGLKVGRGVDERLDIKKSTRAAAKMLRQNYRMLKTWPLAITSYNHGPNGIRRATQAMGTNDLVYLIDHYEKRTWGFASKNFYAEFLAALEILRAQRGA
ncbi:MAG: lytic transglycosylase domain-containing protein [Myxococcota bacterium]